MLILTDERSSNLSAKKRQTSKLCIYSFCPLVVIIVQKLVARNRCVAFIVLSFWYCRLC